MRTSTESRLLLKIDLQLIFAIDGFYDITYNICGSSLRSMACSFDGKRASFVACNR